MVCLAYFIGSHLDSSLERSGFMEGGQKTSKMLVYSSAGGEYLSYFRNSLHFHLQQKENKKPTLNHKEFRLFNQKLKYVKPLPWLWSYV